jgi:DNA-binding transcriptional LysR family regulator
MDKFLEMRVYTQVVEAGSFIGATQRLSMSKAAVSRYVSELEARLGVRLLNRTTRRLSLTEDGALFYQRCKEVLAALASAEGEVASRSEQAIGQLKLNVPVSFGILHLARVWPAFKAAHPQITFDVTLSDRIVDIVDEGFDLAIRISQLPNSSLISRQLASTRIVMCASPGYLAKAGTPTHPSEIADHAVIAYSHWAARDEWEFSGPSGRVRVKTTPYLRTNNGDTCRTAALMDQGIILQPTFMVGEDLAAGRLVEICPAFQMPAMGVYAVYSSRLHQLPKVRLLIDFLVAHFAQARWPDA